MVTSLETSRSFELALEEMNRMGSSREVSQKAILSGILKSKRTIRSLAKRLCGSLPPLVPVFVLPLEDKVRILEYFPQENRLFISERSVGVIDKGSFVLYDQKLIYRDESPETYWVDYGKDIIEALIGFDKKASGGAGIEESTFTWGNSVHSLIPQEDCPSLLLPVRQYFKL